MLAKTIVSRPSAPEITTGGLTSAEAARRLNDVGANEPVRSHRLSTALQLVHLFVNPLVIILLAASAISALLGQTPDAVIIVSIVLLGVA